MSSDAHALSGLAGRAERLREGRPKIAIATAGRFWLLDLARELIALGHDVTFYSMLPDRRCEKFGLDRRHCRSVLPSVAPMLAWEHFWPKLAPSLRERLFFQALNRAIIARLEPCDLFIGVSGGILEAACHARRAFDAKVFIERGSTHILAQAEVLAAAGAPGPSQFTIDRELRGYAMADRIVVPAKHGSESFDRDPGASAKLFWNPYGVDLAHFPKRSTRHQGAPTVLMVGGWLHRKGVDILTAAMQQLPDARLVHVGGLGDVPFPNNPRMIHHDSVDQTKLSPFYQEADVFVLPSREDGLGMVILQALATGLPVVFSDGTGGRDLRFSETLSRRMDEVPAGDVDALAQAIRKRLDARHELPDISDEDRYLLSWERYARHYVPLIRQTFTADAAS